MTKNIANNTVAVLNRESLDCQSNDTLEFTKNYNICDIQKRNSNNIYHIKFSTMGGITEKVKLLAEYIKTGDKKLQLQLKLNLPDNYLENVIIHENIIKLKNNNCEDLLMYESDMDVKNFINFSKNKKIDLLMAQQVVGAIEQVSEIEITKLILSIKNKDFNYKNIYAILITKIDTIVNELLKGYDLKDIIIINLKIKCIKEASKKLYTIFYMDTSLNFEKFKNEKSNLSQALLGEMVKLDYSSEDIQRLRKEFEELNNMIANYTKEYEKNIFGLNEINEILYYYNSEVEFFDFKEYQNYIRRLIRFGEYKNLKAKQKAINKIFVIFEGKEIYDGQVAIIPKRDYMINDSSKFKTSFYSFLMSGLISSEDFLQLSTKKSSKDIREFYLYSRTGNYTGILGINHIALLIALENVFITCEQYIDNDGQLFFKKMDLIKLFGENFRGRREELFLDLMRDLSQVLIKVKTLKGCRYLEGKNINKKEFEELGQIEGNLISFKKFINSDGNYIYKIGMPFLKELIKKSTRNTMKSIELIKYTFQQPKNMILAEYISNVLFYHVKHNGNIPKKISIKSVLDQLSLYDEYVNMSAKDCNTYLKRLKNNIEIACNCIRNIKTIEFTKLTKTLINDKSHGFTIYLNSNLDN